MATGWSLDFCLVCDQQTSGGGAYCSQGCRLADLDQQPSESSLSSYPMFLSSKSTIQSKTSSMSSQYSSRIPTMTPIKGGAATQGSSSSSSAASPQEQSSGLLSNSSQTSLSSLTSSLSPSVALSHQARHDLQDYTKCFDQVRDWKRRLTNS